MSLAFNQLFRVSWTQMETLQVLRVEPVWKGECGSVARKRERTLLSPLPVGVSSPSRWHVPQIPPVPRAEAAVGIEDSARRTVICLQGPVLGAALLLSLSDTEDLLWNKEHLAYCLFLIADVIYFHWTSESSPGWARRLGFRDEQGQFMSAWTPRLVGKTQSPQAMQRDERTQRGRRRCKCPWGPLSQISSLL